MKRSGFNVVESRVWKDKKVRARPPGGRLVWLWLLTNRACNLSGVYELSVETASGDTGLTRAEVAKHLGSFERSGMIRRDPDLGAVWVVQRMGVECYSEAQWTGARRQVMHFEGAAFWEEIRTLYPRLQIPSGGPSPIPSPPPSQGGSGGPSGGHEHTDVDVDTDEDMSPRGDRDIESNGKDGEPWGPFMGPGEALTPQGIAYLWNSVAKQYGAPRVSTFPDRRRRKAKVALGEEADPKVWAAAFHAMCQDPFLAGKNDRDRVYATFDYAMSGKRDQWMDGARNSDEEVIP